MKILQPKNTSRLKPYTSHLFLIENFLSIWNKNYR